MVGRDQQRQLALEDASFLTTSLFVCARSKMLRGFNLLRSRVSMANSMLRAGPKAAVQKRFLSIHEHCSMGLLNQYGIKTPKFLTAATADEAFAAAQKFDGKPVVIKAQVLAGGRGKGHFDNGYQGGVHLVQTCVSCYNVLISVRKKLRRLRPRCLAPN